MAEEERIELSYAEARLVLWMIEFLRDGPIHRDTKRRMQRLYIYLVKELPYGELPDNVLPPHDDDDEDEGAGNEAIDSSDLTVAERTWPPCEVCGQAVTMAAGMLSIDQSLASEREREFKALETRPTPIMDAQDLLSGPEEVPWLWSHVGCAPDENGYSIDAERIQTLAHALDWTLHLQGKSWYDATD